MKITIEVPEPVMIHRYPRNSKYRLSRNFNTAQLGDIARCGHIKDRPPGDVLDGLPRCQNCARLERMGR